MNILITGATGFIGRNLVRELIKDDKNKIFCLVRRTSNIAPLDGLGVEFIYGAIDDYRSLETAVTQPIDIIYHCAAYVGNNDKKRLQKDNVEGTDNVLRLAQSRGCKKVVYLSSVAVVTGNPRVPLIEELPYSATNPYGESKIAAEKITLEYRRRGLKVAILRPCMVYGEDEPHLLKTLLFALKRRLYPLIKGGQVKFHLGYVKTVVDAMIFAAAHDACLEGTFFVADREVLTNREVMAIMASAIGASPPWEMPDCITSLVFRLPYIGKRLRFFQKDRAYSTSRLESLGFKFRYSARTAIADSCNALQSR